MPQTLSSLTIDEKRKVAAALIAERARRQASYPLSSAQLRLWLIDRQLGAEANYNVSRAFSLEGMLDVAALERSVGEILRRHSALRTTFHFTDGQPLQRISEPEAFEFTKRDLGDIPRDGRRLEAERIAEREARQKFRLDRDPMLRGLLVRMEDVQHVLIFTFHHISVDERSLEIFYDELRSFYEKFSHGAAPDLAQTRIQYVDFALWEAAQNQSESVRSQLDYWRRRLAGIPSQATTLLRALPPAERSSRARALQSAFVRPERVDGLLEIARRVRATPFMTYLAAIAVLLHDLSAAEDIVIGSPISGRRRLDTQNVIGFFANAVALRFDFSAAPSFAQIVAHAKTITLEAFANGDVPFDRVVGAVAARRSVTANPLFQVVFAMQTAGNVAPRLAGLTVTPLPQTQSDAKFDLLVHCVERDGGLEVAFHYNSDLVDDSAITAMSARLGDAIERLVANPDVSVASLGFGRAIRETETAQAAAARPDLATNAPRNAASDAVELRLFELWERLLGVRPTGIRDDFFALGGHSLSAVRLVALIEESFGVRLPLATLFREPTIERLAGAIVSEAAETEKAPPPLSYVRQGTAGAPLIIFHGDLNGVAAYVRAFATRLGDRTIVSIAPHGADGGPIPPTIEAMAAERLALLQRENIHPPYDLAGYCNGAVVALEVARQLAASATPAPRIFAIGMEVHEPATRLVTSLVWRFGDLAHLSERARTRLALRLLFRWNRLAAARGAGAKATFALRAMRSLSRAALRAAPGAEAGSRGAGERVPPITGAYAERIIRYRPGAYTGRIVVFRPSAGRPDARARGWARVSTSVTVVPVDGDHLTSVTVHAATLAERLREYLDR